MHRSLGYDREAYPDQRPPRRRTLGDRIFICCITRGNSIIFAILLVMIHLNIRILMMDDDETTPPEEKLLGLKVENITDPNIRLKRSLSTTLQPAPTPVDFRKFNFATEWVNFTYFPFPVDVPHFPDNESKALFHRIPKIERFIVQEEQREGGLAGTISVTEYGEYNHKYNCGYKGDRSQFARKMAPEEQKNIHPGVVCPLNVPNAQTFQHFTDGVLPKLMQARKFLISHPEAQLAVPVDDKKFPLIRQIYHRLGIKDSQLVPYSPRVKARYLVNLCHAPPLHPYIWHEARRVLGVDPEYNKGNLVILLKRTKSNAYNGGRMLLNHDEVVQYLSKRYKERLIVFDSRDYPTLNQTIGLFQNASIILGVHGGACFNNLFAPKHATLIEYMPQDFKTAQIPLTHPAYLVWMFATLLGQHFWRVSSPMIGKDMKMRIPVLHHLLDQVENQTLHYKEPVNRNPKTPIITIQKNRVPESILIKPMQPKEPLKNNQKNSKVS